jgi:hypothetical protein
MGPLCDNFLHNHDNVNGILKGLLLYGLLHPGENPSAWFQNRVAYWMQKGTSKPGLVVHAGNPSTQ